MIISLIGFMAAGKTTVGKELAKSLNSQFIDLDAFIEEKEGKTISEIFEHNGESHFRGLEEKYLQDILEEHISKNPSTLDDLPKKEIEKIEDDEPISKKKCTLIIALGGGTVTNQICADLISDLTYCVYLKADIETILSRLNAEEKEKRPMLGLGKSILELYKSRELIYESLADKTI